MPARRCQRRIVVLNSGQPLLISPALEQTNAFVAAWLPRLEGQGTTTVLFGNYAFSGTLPVTWPRSMAQVPLAQASDDPQNCPNRHRYQLVVDLRVPRV